MLDKQLIDIGTPWELGDPLFAICRDQHLGMGTTHAARAGDKLPLAFVERLAFYNTRDQRFCFGKRFDRHERLLINGAVLFEAGRHSECAKTAVARIPKLVQRTHTGRTRDDPNHSLSPTIRHGIVDRAGSHHVFQRSMCLFVVG